MTGADAIHPGYGFLAENAEFSEICQRSDITFIGPTPEQIRQMGDKAAARRTMVAAGVPVVPGTDVITDADEALAQAREIGFPVLVKAAAGGGGKGMRVATEEAEFPRQFAMARNEAGAAFGDESVYIEKYLAHPRHIEFQILGDQHGRVIHLGERDCSWQRRHQKLVEEAPSPALTPELRARMGEAAVRGAKAIDYVGAGTIEMLLNEDGSFYFMEMNTRIQVEAPGHGDDYRLRPDQGTDPGRDRAPAFHPRRTDFLRGHAIECRINAEDPERNFAPSPGTIQTFHPPGGPGVRLDSHIYAGYRVPPYYDSLLAKVIVHGATREEAIARMRQTLTSMVIEGYIPRSLFCSG